MSPVAAVASGERKLSLSFGIPDTLELALLLRCRHYLCKLHLQTVLKAAPPFPVKECGSLLCALAIPWLKIGPQRKSAFYVSFSSIFRLFSNVSRATDFSPCARGSREGLSAKQMPLSDPRQVEEMYPAMSNASPIGFQGKSDAAATLLLPFPSSLPPLIAVN